MKRNTFLYGILLAAGLSVCGCSDQFLKDMDPRDKYSPEKTFGIESNLDQYIQHVYYNSFRMSSPTKSYSITGSFPDYTGYTEEKGGIEDRINANNTYEDAGDCDKYFGKSLTSNISNDPYNRIRSCNEILEGVDLYGQDLSEEAANKAKGQACFMRAIQLFDLVRIYGGVPIVDKVLDPTDQQGARAYNRESVEQCVAQITADLDQAAAMLPTRAEWGAAGYGRLTKEAALAYKSRVLLVFASPVFNADWDNPANQRWADALKAAQEAKTFLDAEGYGLYGSSAKDWNEMFYKYDNVFCKEAIMVKILSSDAMKEYEHSSWQASIRPKTMGGGGAGYTVPMGMLSIFPMADGKPAIAGNGYDEFLFFKNRDPRFYYTFAFSGQKWGYDKDAGAVLWNYRWSDGAKNHYYAGDMGGSSPAIVRKMSDPEENSANTYQYDGTDVLEYRYAELLLNLAECYAAQGNTGETLNIIGLIRARVGIPAGADGTYGVGHLAGSHEAIKACLRERQIELAYEGKRYWDIWRWMLFNDDANDDNNTCATLGIPQLNGTHRIGKYLQVAGEGFTKDDPLAAEVNGFTPVDIDNAEDLQAALDRLASFWKAHFKLQDTDTPLDNINNVQADIAWRQNYYLSGLPSNVLTMNPWLQQSKGWLDAYDGAGTYDARK